jgi:hypothetical protein
MPVAYPILTQFWAPPPFLRESRAGHKPHRRQDVLVFVVGSLGVVSSFVGRTDAMEDFSSILIIKLRQVRADGDPGEVVERLVARTNEQLALLEHRANRPKVFIPEAAVTSCLASTFGSVVR